MAEAAGFALAILPLLVSVAQHYSETAAAFKRFRRFASEATNLASLLKIQWTIFRAAKKILLNSVVGTEQAKEMLEDPQHPGWTDQKSDDSLLRQLGDCSEAVLESTRLISEQLEALAKESDKFQEAVAGRNEVRTPTTE